MSPKPLSCLLVAATAAGCLSSGAEQSHVAAPDTKAFAFKVEDIADEQGRKYHIDQGERGKPEVVGCADGTREAFVDAAAFPRIAGCLAAWQGRQSLRAATTGAPCGDDIGGCGAPGDACAVGWHICGEDGDLADLRQITGEQCEHAGGGRFTAALSHCKAQSGCVYDNQPTANYDCFSGGWCSEPVCCGSDCGALGICKSGVWVGKTHIPTGQDQSCASAASHRAAGVLCCKSAR
jgi:hypothetical protein